MCEIKPQRHTDKQWCDTYLVIITGVNISRHAKVWDFDHQVSTNEAVSSGKVSVDEVSVCEVDHTIGNLSGNIHQISLEWITVSYIGIIAVSMASIKIKIFNLWAGQGLYILLYGDLGILDIDSAPYKSSYYYYIDLE